MAQVLKPNADVSNATFQTQSAGSTNLFACLNDGSDTTYIKSLGDVSDTYVCGLQTGSNPSNTTGWSMSFRHATTFQGTTPDTVTVTYKLMQGSTTIFTQTAFGLKSTTITTATYTIDSTSAGNVTDFTALRLSITAGDAPQANNNFLQVYEASLSIPDAATSTGHGGLTTRGVG